MKTTKSQIEVKDDKISVSFDSMDTLIRACDEVLALSGYIPDVRKATSKDDELYKFEFYLPIKEEEAEEDQISYDGYTLMDLAGMLIIGLLIGFGGAVIINILFFS
jgi:hypothetical protein